MPLRAYSRVVQTKKSLVRLGSFVWLTGGFCRQLKKNGSSAMQRNWRSAAYFFRGSEIAISDPLSISEFYKIIYRK